VDSTENRSLNFTMERFLPDITASSALCALNNSDKKLPYPYNYSEEYVSRTVGRSYPSRLWPRSSTPMVHGAQALWCKELNKIERVLTQKRKK